MIIKGYKKILVFEDMYELLDEFEAKKVLPMFLEEWESQCKRKTKPK